jgi:hypothetical protein
MTNRQLRALVGLRWRMIRRRPVRLGLGVLVAALPLVLALAVAIGKNQPAVGGLAVTVVTPGMFLSVAVLAVVAPLAAGGGNELYPAEQLVAFPVRPATLVSASLLLSPLNLAWLAQVLALMGVTGTITGDGPRLALAVLTSLAYLAFVSVAGQSVAWLVVGVRHTRAGRVAVAAVAVAGSAAAVTIALTHHVVGALEHMPTTSAVGLVREASAGPTGQWLTGFTVLVLGTAVAAGWAVRACGWALSRPGDLTGDREGRPIRRRPAAGGVLAELAAVDRASIVRSVPLRRGVLVLAFLPGAAAALTAVEWPSIVMLPGLVGAGAGLLFGVNVFCLDASGAVWLASLPHDPRLAYLAKARVLAEVCAGTGVLTVAIAALRAPTPPTAAQLSAVAASIVACTAAVVASCMHMSVHRPHRADLRSSRDTPAPPGSMVVYSLRLSVVATLTASLMAALAYATEHPWLPLAVAVPLTLRALFALHRASLGWRNPEPRARVVAAVSAG